jgi:hypothetical protein
MDENKKREKKKRSAYLSIHINKLCMQTFFHNGIDSSYENLKPVIATAVGVCVCVCARARVFPSLQLYTGTVSTFAFLYLPCD